jgi:hypothetical protein
MNSINIQNIQSISKWAKFIGTFIIIVAVFMLIAGVSVLFVDSSNLEAIIDNIALKAPQVRIITALGFSKIITLIFLLIGAIFFYIGNIQIKASNQLQKYIASNDEQFLYTGIKSIGTYFRFYVIISLLSFISVLTGLISIFLNH